MFFKSASPVKNLSLLCLACGVLSFPHQLLAKEEILSFFTDVPAEALALSHSGHIGFPLFPGKMPALPAYGDNKGLALMVQITNEQGDVVGFASELEDFPTVSEQGLGTWKTLWSLTIPGEGSLVAYQEETLPKEVVAVFDDVMASGEPWTGEITLPNTIGPLPNKRGIIMGGTGKYADIKGEFVEIGTTTGMTEKGELTARIELRFILQKP